MVTREQALAFVEALTDWTKCTENGEDYGERQSPHAYTHLAAALGRPANWYDFTPLTTQTGDRAARCDALLDYLQGVVDALRPEGYPTRRALIDLLRRHAASRACLEPTGLDTETEEALARSEGRGKP